MLLYEVLSVENGLVWTCMRSVPLVRYRHLVRGALEAQWAAVEPELRATVEAGVETLGTCAAVRRATAAGLRQ